MKVRWRDGTCDPPTESNNIYYMTLIFITPLLLVFLYISGFLTWSPVERILSTKFVFFNMYPIRWLFGGPLTLGMLLSFMIFIILALLLVVVYNMRLDEVEENRHLNIISGDLTMVNMWMAMLPTARTSIFTKFHGIPYERAIRFHKTFTTFAMLGAILHAFVSFDRYPDMILSNEIFGENEIVPLYGLIAFILMCIMSLTSIWIIRRKNYELFFILHQLYIPTVIFLCFHVKDVYIGFLPGIVLKCIDEVVRTYAMVRATETLECSVNGDVTELKCRMPAYNGEVGYSYNNVPDTELTKVSKINPVTRTAESCSIEYTAKFSLDIDQIGQWYFIMIPEVDYSFHPISVSGVDIVNRSFSFHIKSMGPGTWSQRVNTLVRGKSDKKQIVVSLDGPQGKHFIDIRKYSLVTIIAGGIGITPMLPILESLKVGSKTQFPNLTHVNLIWSVRDLELLNTFQKQLQNIFGTVSDATVEGVSFSIRIHDTNSGQGELKTQSCPFLISRGRPDLESCISPTEQDIQCVFVCGPDSMVEVATKSCIDQGIDFHSEIFSW